MQYKSSMKYNVNEYMQHPSTNQQPNNNLFYVATQNFGVR